ncbi:hypothetical protein [Streptomyces sp. NPDC048425]|uniref:hypothetical protein n=1 Tax=Streptomyces sp. NPDC048425 TaxID=3365548 RepID=UPI003717039D
MTAPDSLPLHALVEDNLAAASPDLLRAMVKTFADALMIERQVRRALRGEMRGLYPGTKESVPRDG